MKDVVCNYHKDALASFRNYKKLAERAMVQVSDEEFFAVNGKWTRKKAGTNEPAFCRSVPF